MGRGEEGREVGRVSLPEPTASPLPGLAARDTYFEQTSNHPIEHVPLCFATNSNAANEEEVWSGVLMGRRHAQVRKSGLLSGQVGQRPRQLQCFQRSRKPPFLSTPGVT